MIGRWERRLTLTGAGLGLALVGLGFLLASGSAIEDSDDHWRRDPLRLALAAIGVAPYALAIAASRAASSRPGARAAMLLAILLPAAAAAMISYLVLLPSFVLLAGATMIALRRASPGRFRRAVLLALAAVTITLAWFASFLVLFAIEDERCWTLANGGLTCSSDVVTAPEALAALTLLVAAGAVATLVLWLAARGGRRPSTAL